MEAPERTMATATGMGTGGGVVGRAGGTMLSALVAGGLGYIMGLMCVVVGRLMGFLACALIGNAIGEKPGFWLGRGAR